MTIACTLTNTRATGNVTVVKSATGGPFDAGQTFTFTRTGTGASGTVTLAPGGSSTVAVNAGLTAGFTETANPNFSTTFSCTNGVTGTGTVIAPFNVAAGAEHHLHLRQHPADGADQGHQGAAALERPGPVQHLRRRHGPGQRRRRLGHLADDLPRRPPWCRWARPAAPNPATDLRNYTTTIGCVVENTGAVVVAAGTPLTGDLTRQLNVTVRPGVTIACTLTNTRATNTVQFLKTGAARDCSTSPAWAACPTSPSPPAAPGFSVTLPIGTIVGATRGRSTTSSTSPSPARTASPG